MAASVKIKNTKGQPSHVMVKLTRSTSAAQDLQVRITGADLPTVIKPWCGSVPHIKQSQIGTDVSSATIFLKGPIFLTNKKKKT